jgi:hypothetical protein
MQGIFISRQINGNTSTLNITEDKGHTKRLDTLIIAHCATVQVGTGKQFHQLLSKQHFALSPCCYLSFSTKLTYLLGRGKLVLCLSMHILSMALDGGEWSVPRSSRFTFGKRALGTHWIKRLGGGGGGHSRSKLGGEDPLSLPAIEPQSSYP